MKKITKQELVFNLKIFINENLYQDNSLNEIIDYDQIIKIIKKILNEDINFLETLSEKIITKIFDDQRVNKVKIRIEKTQAVKECESVGYEITKKEFRNMNSLEQGKEIFKNKSKLCSNSPGVYQVFDEKNKIIYVGKAKNLPNRLSNYSSSSTQPIRTERE